MAGPQVAISEKQKAKLINWQACVSTLKAVKAEVEPTGYYFFPKPLYSPFSLGKASLILHLQQLGITALAPRSPSPKRQ